MMQVQAPPASVTVPTDLVMELPLLKEGETQQDEGVGMFLKTIWLWGLAGHITSPIYRKNPHLRAVPRNSLLREVSLTK